MSRKTLGRLSLIVSSRSPQLKISAGAMTLLYNGVKLAVGISGQKSKKGDGGKGAQADHLHWKPPERIFAPEPSRENIGDGDEYTDSKLLQDEKLMLFFFFFFASN